MPRLFVHPSDPPAPATYPVARVVETGDALLSPAAAGWQTAAVVEWGDDRYRTRFRALWTAEASGRIVGMIAAAPMREDSAWEISRMYVARPYRGTGLAARLLTAAEDRIRAAGARRVVLWTDTRFEAAHRFYEKHSFVRAGSIRVLDDKSRSLEFRYAKPVAGTVVEVLDAAAAVSAERRLAEVLKACVDDGAVVGFLAPLATEKARSFWRDRAAEVGARPAARERGEVRQPEPRDRVGTQAIEDEQDHAADGGHARHGASGRDGMRSGIATEARGRVYRTEGRAVAPS